MRKIYTNKEKMRDISEYNEIYNKNCRCEMYLDFDGSLSFVEATYTEAEDSCIEVIVDSKTLSNALDTEALKALTFSGKMTLLFGCYRGMEHFLKFCDEKGIETMTLTWD